MEKGALTYMYLLSKGVHQKQDKRLMPSDDEMRQNAVQRLKAYVDSIVAREITNL